MASFLRSWLVDKVKMKKGIKTPMLPRKKASRTSVPIVLPALTTKEILDRIHPPCHGLHPVIRFVFHSEGKRIRPYLLYLSSRLFSSTTPHIAEAATLVEALHNGTLLHDDVMDRARVRRNRPTVNRLWGNGVAILAGDFLLAAAMDLALKTENSSILPLAVETLFQLVEGQMLELQHQGNLSLSERSSIQITKKKTASLFAMACTLGGVLADGDPDQIRALESFGLHVGLAFQLLDDIQDYTSCRTNTGKDPGRDLAEGKVTLPVLVAFQQADTQGKKRIRQIFSDPQRIRCLQELTGFVEDHDGFSYTHRKARDCLERAICSLDVIPASEEKDDIERAAWKILKDNNPIRYVAC